jgi:uracil-DNA glycosylase
MKRKEILTKLLGEEWYEILKDEFDKEYMLKLSNFLVKRRLDTVVYPEPDNVFNAYRMSPLSQTKVVILGQDPYINPNQAMGLSFSIPDSNHTLPPSLGNIRREIEQNLYNGLLVDFNPDLTRWTKQGVFLLNTILTVDKGKSLSHKGLGWEQFTLETILKLNESKHPIIFLLWGNNAKAYGKYITNSNHTILEAGHPSPLSANKGLWFGCNHFSKVNKILKDRGEDEIEWK